MIMNSTMVYAETCVHVHNYTLVKELITIPLNNQMDVAWLYRHAAGQSMNCFCFQHFAL